MLCASMPPWGWWPLAITGIALWLWVLGDQPGRARFVLSWLVGVAWFAPSTLWMWDLTAPGYVAATLLAWGPLIGLVGLASSRDERRVVLLPALLVIFEWFHWHAPFGGAPLSTLAITQAEAPLRPIAALGGPLLLGGVVAALGSALFLAVQGNWRRPLTLLLASVGLAAIGLIVPLGSPSGQVRVAAVRRSWIRARLVSEVSMRAGAGSSGSRTVKCTSAQGDSLTLAA